MPIVPVAPLNSNPASFDSIAIPVLSMNAGKAQLGLPSPVGQPKFGLRLGYAQADTSSFLAGIDLTVPLSVGVRLFAIRGDADYWRHTGSSHGSNAGGEALSLCGIFGPTAGYFGAGVTDASRYGGASGPSGAGFKFLFGSQLLSMVGYEINVITTSKGSMAAAMATLHF